MKRSEITEVVKDAILNTSSEYKPDYEDIKEDSHMRDDLGMDSLDFVEAIIYIEKHLNIGIPDDEISGKENDTVGEMADYLQTKV